MSCKGRFAVWWLLCGEDKKQFMPSVGIWINNLTAEINGTFGLSKMWNVILRLEFKQQRGTELVLQQTYAMYWAKNSYKAHIMLYETGRVITNVNIFIILCSNKNPSAYVCITLLAYYRLHHHNSSTANNKIINYYVNILIWFLNNNKYV